MATTLEERVSALEAQEAHPPVDKTAEKLKFLGGGSATVRFKTMKCMTRRCGSAQSTAAPSRQRRKRSSHWKRLASMYPYLMDNKYEWTAGADAD